MNPPDFESFEVTVNYAQTDEQENEKVENSQNLLNNLHSFDLSSRNILMEWKFSFITNKRCNGRFFVTRIGLPWMFADLSENLFLIMQCKRYENLYYYYYYSENKNFYFSILSRFYIWYSFKILQSWIACIQVTFD